MAYWKDNRLHYAPPKPIKGYPGWVWMDCGCCGGLQWGGATPEDCSLCAGGGRVAQHRMSGVLASWPGGPFLGRANTIT